MNKHNSFFPIVLFGLITSVFTSPGSAADFSLIGSGGPLDGESVLSGHCSIELVGRIEMGDAQKLSQLLGGEIDFGWGEEAIALCLQNSTGGELVAGVELAREISRLGITTIVPEGGNCQSACAIAFLGGVFPYFNNALIPYRMMHSTAIIGFHAPSPDLRGGAVPAHVINEAYAAAAESIHSLSVMSRPADTGVLIMGVQISADALNIILSTPFNKMKYIETYSDAAIFDIVVFDKVAHHRVSEDMAFRLCLNAMYWWRPSAFYRLYFSLQEDLLLFSSKFVEERELASVYELIEEYFVSGLIGTETSTLSSPEGVTRLFPFETRLEFSGTWNESRTCVIHHTGFSKEERWTGEVTYISEYDSAINFGIFDGVHALPLETIIRED